MRFEHKFHLPVEIARAWSILTDLERVAPCMPGAQLLDVNGQDYSGTVKVKVGPITAQYRGIATLIEQDVVAKRMVLEGKGADAFGQGNASAIVTGQLTAQGDRTLVELVTDLQISGKVAQLGQGVMKDVSNRLLKQFVETLKARIDTFQTTSIVVRAPGVSTSEDVKLGGAMPEAKVEGRRRILAGPEPEAIDLLKLGSASVARRYGAVAVAIVGVATLAGWVWRSRRSSS